MQPWQFHRYEGDVYENMAIDEYLFQTAAETGERFLRVFDFDQDGYALGVNESVDDLKLDAIVADDIDFTRRETAGSVINCDASATYFSFIVPAAPGDYKTDLNAEYGPALRDTVVAMGLDPVQTRIADRGGVKMRRTHDEPYRAGIGACQVARDSAALYHGAVYLEPPTDVDRHVDLRSTGGEDEASFVQEFFGIADALDMSPETARQQFATELPSHVPGDYEKFQLSLPARTPSSPSPRRNTAVTGGGAGTVPEPRYGAGSACALSTRTMTGSTELPALLCRGNLREGPRTAAAPLPG